MVLPPKSPSLCNMVGGDNPQENGTLLSRALVVAYGVQPANAADLLLATNLNEFMAMVC